MARGGSIVAGRRAAADAPRGVRRADAAALPLAGGGGFEAEALHPDGFLAFCAEQGADGGVEELVCLYANPAARAWLGAGAREGARLRAELAREGLFERVLKVMEEGQALVEERCHALLGAARPFRLVAIPRGHAGVVLWLSEARERPPDVAFEHQRDSRLWSIASSAALGVVSCDLEGTLLRANAAFLEMVGYRAEDVTAGRLSWRSLSPPERQAESTRATEELRHTGILRPYEKDVLHRDGRRVRVLVATAFLHDRRPEAVALVVDLSERERIAAQLRRAVERTTRLQAVTAALSQARLPSEVVDIALREGAAALGAVAGGVCLFDAEGGGRLSLVAGVGLPEGTLEAMRAFPEDSRLPGALAARTGEALWVEEGPPFYQENPQAGGIIPPIYQDQAMAALPLAAESRRLGSLIFSFPGPHGFSPEDRAFLRALAHGSAQALERARLYEAEQKARAAAEGSALHVQEVLAVLEALLRTAPMGYALFSLDLRYLRINEYLAARNGHPPEAHLGRTVREMVPHLAEQVERQLATVRDTGHSRVNEEMSSRDPVTGHVLHYVVSYFPVRLPDGNMVGIGATVLDVSELKRALQARQEMAAFVSHDLATPLLTVEINASLLQSAAPPGSAGDGVRARTRVIQQSVASMRRLVSDLLDASKLEDRKFPLRTEPVGVEGLVEQAFSMVGPVAERRGVRFHRVPEGGRGLVRCDRERMLQVLTNLLSNAVRFSPRDSVVVVHAHREGAEVRFSVSDSGPGIPPEDQERVFVRFWRARGQQQEGSGLGLYIAKAVVEAHGGRIWVESRPGTGCTFHFTLPAVTA